MHRKFSADQPNHMGAAMGGDEEFLTVTGFNLLHLSDCGTPSYVSFW